MKKNKEEKKSEEKDTEENEYKENEEDRRENEEGEEDRRENEEGDNLETSFEDLSDFFPAFDPRNLILESGEVAPSLPQASADIDFENLEDSLGGVFQDVRRRDEDRDYAPRADYEERQEDYEPKEHQRVELNEAPILREQEEIINPFVPQTELRHVDPFERAEPRNQFEDFQRQQEKYELGDEEKKLPFERKKERRDIF